MAPSQRTYVFGGTGGEVGEGREGGVSESVRQRICVCQLARRSIEE